MSSGVRAFITPDFPNEADAPKECKTCGGEKCEAGSGYSNGSVEGWFGLGSLDEERSAGYLLLHEDSPLGFLSTPLALRAVVDASIDDATHVIRSGGELRQVWTGQTLADIVTLDAYEYEIRWYRADQVGTPSGGGGLYPINGGQTPFKTVVVLNPNGATDAEHLRFTEKDETGSVTLVNEFAWDDTLPGGGAWELYEGLNKTTPTLASAARRTLKTESWNAERTERTQTVTVRNGAGTQTFSKVTEVYQWFPGFGEKLVLRTTDPDGAALTESWAYWTDGDGEGELKSYTSPEGYWEHYEYDADGLRWKTVAQLGDNAYDDTDIPALEAANLVTEYVTYPAELNDADAVDESIARTTVTAAGQLVRRSYRVDWSGAVTLNGVVYQDSWEIDGATADPESGYASTTAFLNALMADSDYLGHEVTQVRRIAAEDGLGQEQDHALETARVIRPEGTMTIYERPQAGRTVSASGYADPQATDPMDVDDIIFGRKSESQVDSGGHAQWSASYARDPNAPGSGGAWFVASLSKTTDTDAFGRPTETSYYFGDQAKAELDSSSGVASYTTSRTYGCCGVQDTTDRAGLTTGYAYDDLGRRVLTTAPTGISTHYTYDAAGRVVLVERESSDSQSTLAVQFTAYDSAGRVSEVSDGLNRMTYYTYREVGEDGAAYDAQTHSQRYQETRVYPHSSGGGPIQVAWTDSHGRTVRSWAASTTATWDELTPPSGGETLTELSRTTMSYDWAGRATETKSYFDVASLTGLNDEGTEGTHYIASGGGSVYDALGRLVKSEDVSGTITVTVYGTSGGGAGRPVEQWVGTDDGSPTDVTAYQDPGTIGGTSNLVQVSQTVYDAYGRVDESRSFGANVTTTDFANQYVATLFDDSYVASGGAVVSREAVTIPAVGPRQWQVHDIQGRLLGGDTWTNDGATMLANSANYYDDENGLLPTAYEDSDSTPSGRLVATRVVEVNDGMPGNYLETVYLYDSAGRQVYTSSPGGGYTLTLYDTHGRMAATRRGADDGGTPLDPSDDVVLTETVYGYDDGDQVITTVSLSRMHNAQSTDVGRLWDDVLEAPESFARARYTAVWYDEAGRVTHTADYGDVAP